MYRLFPLRVRQALLATFLLFCYSITDAHEIRPSITDLILAADGQVKVRIATNAEAWLAGIGPEYANSNDSPNAGQYDQLRASAPATLRAALQAFLPTLMDSMALTVDGEAVPLTPTAIIVDEVGDIEVTRTTQLEFSGRLPANSQFIQWQWLDTLGANALRVSTPEQQDAYTAYLRPGDKSAAIPVSGVIAQSAGSIFRNYVVIGFEHILPKGVDHILFVVGLFLLSIRLKPLIWQISSFTVAHTVTLALGMLGIINLPASLVEPLIAASIVYVAIENLFSDQLSRWRPILVFLFGLLHGLGFASVLTDIGLASEHFALGLIAFNIGVELGQLTVIAACVVLLALPFGQQPWYRQRISIPGSLLIACIAGYWVLERTLLS